MGAAHRELERWGYDDQFRSAFEALGAPELQPARVTVGYRRLYDLITEVGAVAAAGVAGRFKHTHEAEGALAFPAVGDWVGVDLSSPGSAVIQAVLPRRTAFVRKAAGRADEAQVVAANVDVVFLLSALDDDLNFRRIERYLSLAAQSGARPVVVLNKSDLYEGDREGLRAVVGDTPVHTISARSGDGVETLKTYFEGDRTVALLGSSGVGKSTLTNRLLGEDVQKTAAVRSDGRGRHVTTNRYLFRLPDGGLILDTPGMRELHVWEGERGVEDAFADIVELARHCRFRDCRHDREPGCAVRAAIDSGELSEDRLRAYRALQKEASSATWARTRRYR